jgi:hypothetical protein
MRVTWDIRFPFADILVVSRNDFVSSVRGMPHLCARILVMLPQARISADSLVAIPTAVGDASNTDKIAFDRLAGEFDLEVF